VNGESLRVGAGRLRPGSGGSLGGAPLLPDDSGARLFRPEMLMIGATGRNTGKTELACQIIRNQAAQASIAALKVTTVVRTDGSCPRGGAGCGVCSSLAESWCVTRELDADSDKDTSRLLESGAREAYWLRVREEALRDGAVGLLAHIPAGWASVCESNSLSRVVEPGLFLQVRAASERAVKTSARAVTSLADRVVVSDGATFDLALHRISLLGGQWALQRDACAVVIADSPPVPSLVGSLRAQFTQVEIVAVSSAPADERQVLSALSEALPRSLHEWCLVASAPGCAIPAALVNAMFRRREGVETVVARDPSVDQTFRLGLFHRGLLPKLVAAVDGASSPARSLATLGQVRELRLAPGDRRRLDTSRPRAQKAPR
jgi:hypothetical protein